MTSYLTTETGEQMIKTISTILETIALLMEAADLATMRIESLENRMAKLEKVKK